MDIPQQLELHPICTVNILLVGDSIQKSVNTQIFDSLRNKSEYVLFRFQLITKKDEVSQVLNPGQLDLEMNVLPDDPPALLIISHDAYTRLRLHFDLGN